MDELQRQCAHLLRHRADHWQLVGHGHRQRWHAERVLGQPYDASKRHWTQFWIGSDGVILHLVGGLQGKDMVMEGRLPGAKGGEQWQRITWTPADDGTVVQTWQTSDDAGKTWQISFRGIYHRVGRALPLKQPAPKQ